MKNQILVTGGAGYIGSAVTRKLLESGYAVTVVDNLCKGNRALVPENVDFMEFDLLDEVRLNELFDKNNFVAVIHLAALIDVAESMHAPQKFFENNVRASFVLLETMRKRSLNKLIFSSTAGVYGNPQEGFLQEGKIAENHPVAPTNFYATSKAMMERLILDYSRYFSLENIVFRYFNVAGASLESNLGNLQKNPGAVIPRVLLSLLDEKPFQMYGGDYPTRDGSSIRDFIHVVDLAEAHLRGLERLLTVSERSASSEIFNLGSENGFSLLEMIKVAEEVTGKKLKLQVAERREGDIVVSVAASKLAQEILDWRPERSLRVIMEDSWNWYNSDFYRQKAC